MRTPAESLDDRPTKRGLWVSQSHSVAESRSARPCLQSGVDALARMLDANINRAREGLRVMEDAARFGLDDAGLCGEIKAIRHELLTALHEAGVRPAELLAARDTPGDVGTSISTPAEGRRDGLRPLRASHRRNRPSRPPVDDVEHK